MIDDEMIDVKDLIENRLKPYRRRKLIQICEDLINQAYDSSLENNLDEQIEDALTKLSKIRVNLGGEKS